jgi:O-succinylbenzoic acid--CoA ligase
MSSRRFETSDLGRIDARGHLEILGRRDAVIISGGEKIQPAEVEAALRATGEFSDVAVIGVPDAEWGQVVVACYPAKERAPDLRAIEEKMIQVAGFKRPKRYVAISEWPRNLQGKLNRAALLALFGTGESKS